MVSCSTGLPASMIFRSMRARADSTGPSAADRTTIQVFRTWDCSAW